MSLRSISTDGISAVEPATTFGAAPQLQWIKVADLRVDDSYQRPIDTPTSRASIRAIAARFDWRYFAPVVTSPIIGGLFAVVDGQHRATAAALCGIELVPCMVIIADPREQAQAFRAINGQVTRVSGGQLFRARIAACDAEATRVRACCEKAGVRLLFSNQQAAKMKPNETYALNVISSLVTTHGDAAVTRGLQAIRASAGDCQGYLTAGIIKPVVSCLAEHPGWLHHSGLDAALSHLDLRDERERAAESARRHPGQTTAINLALRVAAHLEATLSRHGRAAA